MKTLKGVIAASTFAEYETPLNDSNLFIEPWYFTLSSKLYVVEKFDSMSIEPIIPNWYIKDIIIEQEYGKDTATVSPFISIQLEDSVIKFDDGAVIGPVLGNIKVSELINYEPESSLVSPTQPTLKYSVGTVNREKEDVAVSPTVGFEII